MNRIFVAKKPQWVSSNRYLSILKKRYGVKKGGFSGTLDPFAVGTLIVAFGQYTKLFQFLKKSPKVYRAVLWLGAKSDSLDLENFRGVEPVSKLDIQQIEDTLKSLEGDIYYSPPLFSAKHVNGTRAYRLAKDGKHVKLPEIQSTIYSTKLLNYSHPFIHFEIEVSEGSYIRSIGEILAKRLGSFGTLSYLNRISEGRFKFDNEKSLNPLDILEFEKNRYFGEEKDILNGTKIDISKLEKREDGKYIVPLSRHFSIIQISNHQVSYLLNRIAYPD